jgi:hypothetical protein
MTHKPASDIAFTDRVKALQEKAGSRRAYARMEQGDGRRTAVDDELRDFIAAQRSFFMATVNADGQPYIQHRGGPPGFLQALDDEHLAFADVQGNRQYISVGNLEDSARVHLFLIDYAHQQRIKVWGEARVVDDPALVARLTVEGGGRPERAIVIRVVAWDVNCPQHIPQRFEADDVKAALAARDARIEALEAEVKRLRAR